MPMAINVDIPAMGESVTEAVLLEWLRHDGERVEAEEPLCLLETEKANVELPAPAAGVLRTLKQVGETIRVGETIARLEAPTAEPHPTAAPRRPTRRAAEPAEAAPVADTETAAPPPEDFSPTVRRLLAEHHIDPATLRGSGRGGRLTKEDVLTAVEARSAQQEALAPAAEPETAPEPPRTELPAEAPAAAPPVRDQEGIKRVPMSKIRRRIAENLLAAKQQTAMLTTFNEIDMTAILELRAQHRERFASVHGVSLGLMSFFTRACVLALRAFPVLNARIDGNDIVYYQYVHMGIAVSTERGLVVPVLRHVEHMTLAHIEAEMQRVASAARDGKLGIQELSGGTFTITNGGVFGSLLSTPLLHPPQSGILGMHAIQKRPIAVHDRVEIRPMMYVALSYDHRLVDGREAVSFLVRVKELLEDPTRLLLEI
jgi:2-oxoglutarate dehydrogenase E2 component (dihydrolipoamide succinyltransferase)